MNNPLSIVEVARETEKLRRKLEQTKREIAKIWAGHIAGSTRHRLDSIMARRSAIKAELRILAIRAREAGCDPVRATEVPPLGEEN